MVVNPGGFNTSVGGTATMLVADGFGSGGSTLAEISSSSGQWYTPVTGGFAMAAIAAIGGWYVWKRRRLGQG